MVRRVRSVRFTDDEWVTVTKLAALAEQKPAEYLREKSFTVANALQGVSQPTHHNAHPVLWRK